MRSTIINCLCCVNLLSLTYVIYLIALLSLTSKLSITLKVVGLGLLLKVLLTSSTERTLFPTDSEKSVIILFAKITSFDIVFEFIDNEFSFTKSKS